MIKWHVVLPTYQQGMYLEDALRSVERASAGDVLVTIVDDCSPDETPEISAYLQTIYPWVRYMRLPSNLGVAAARNAGIAAQESQYVLALDPDDRISRRYFDICEQVLQTYDIAFTDRQRYGLSHEFYPASRVTLARLQQGPFIHCSCPFRREVWTQLGGYDESDEIRLNFEDYDFWIRAAKAGFSFGLAPRLARLWHRKHHRHKYQYEATRRQLNSHVLLRDAIDAIKRKHPGFYTQRV